LTSLEREIRSGNARAAIERVLSSYREDRDDPTHWKLEIERIARAIGVRGALHGLEREEGAIRELFAEARCRLTPEVEVLWHPDDRRVGVATFPVACSEAGALFGSVREIAVGAEPGRHGPSEVAFSRSVERARSAAMRAVGGARGRSLADLTYRIVPDVPSNAAIEGGSCGLAAFVAFLSHATGIPISDRYAFTGTFTDEVLRLAEPPRETLPLKLAALRERPRVDLLFSAASFDTKGSKVELCEERDALVIAWRVLGRRLGEIGAGVEESDELSLRVRAIQAAALSPVSASTIERALYVADAWPTPSSLQGVVLDEILDRIAETKIVDRVRVDRAHRALFSLARAKDAPGDLEAALPLHAFMSGAKDEAKRALSSIAAKGRVTESLANLRAVSRARSENEARDLSRGLEGSASAKLVEIAFWLERCPAPFPSLVSRLERSDGALDRLLWVQSACELLLHLFTALSMASDPRGDEERRAKLAERPSLGELFGEAFALAASESALGRSARSVLLGREEAGRRGVERALAILRERVLEPLNRRLHRLGRWEASAPPEEELFEIASSLAPIFERLAAFFADYALSIEGERCTLRSRSGEVSDLSALVIPANGDLVFHRGLIDGRARFWSFSTGAVRYAGLPDREDLLAAASGAVLPVQLFPLPISRSLIELRGAERQSLDVLDLLHAADTIVECTLRLVWFACFDRANPRGATVWLPRATKRAIFAQILAIEAKPISEDLVRSSHEVLAIIDSLERLEHATPPLSDHRERVVRLGRAITDLLSRSPWARGELALVGRSLSFTGPMPKGSESGSTLAPREVALLGRDGLISLWPFALTEEDAKGRAELALLAFAKGRRRDPLQAFEPSYLTIDPRGRMTVGARRWTPSDRAPLGIDVE
jgi:hypothetical protein